MAANPEKEKLDEQTAPGPPGLWTAGDVIRKSFLDVRLFGVKVHLLFS